MNSTESNISPIDNHPPSDDRRNSPPAFLDLADSAARLGSNLQDPRELKRLEHQRALAQEKWKFEQRMLRLAEQQAKELLHISGGASGGPNRGDQILMSSAPTTPPRVNVPLRNVNTLAPTHGRQQVDVDFLSKAVGGVADKRKSVTYAPSVNLSPDPNGPTSNGFARPAGAKSMPASRRTSASEHDEDIALHLKGLSLAGGDHSTRASPAPAPLSASILLRNNGRFANDEGARYASTYNAGMLLDEQLDKEMHNAMRHLPTSDEADKFNAYHNRVSASAALDLAHISQTSPRSSFANARHLDNRDKSSEWPQFHGTPRGPEGAPRSDRRNVTNPNLTLSTPTEDISGKILSGSATPLIAQTSQGSAHSINQGSHSPRGSSPQSYLDSISSHSAHSVPATPMGLPTTGGHLLKTPGTPHTPDLLNGRIATPNSHTGSDVPLNPADLQASLSRIPGGAYDSSSSLTFNSIQPGRDDYESVYGLNANGDRFNGYSLDPNNRANSLSAGVPGSIPPSALYPQNSNRYNVGMGSRGNNDGKMNGLHGPKHKRGDMDREFNRFAGTRLEDLQGEIPGLCKDQHGCRYLQKKLEEGIPEHRDIIFRETFSHFADLMTDPFGNYLCQKLLEYSTDEQRNLICESVAQDLVNISLNMHGTRAVQKMIDFLSTRRQTDHRYNAQIHSIILALSLHVVVLIKDLNGNHVIQKCLNKLAPEDNQFIYNAVAANCVEVATHRHGCCVLQRCIDHASDMQRAQLVNEITYNALTLVQDPYGNYVVQYILDLNDSRFSDAVIRQFTGNVCALSVQKFSSNVIEKCIRVAEPGTRKILIEELLNRSRLEKLLRDSYGNYCVQTALDYAEPTQRALLVEGIRPVLPLIRNTPYGKRIQNKLQREQMDHFGGFPSQHGLVGMGLNNPSQGTPHGVPRHLPPTIAANPLTDLYGTPNALYLAGQGNFGQSGHLNSPLHSLQPSIDGYVLQGNSSHNQGMQQAHPQGSQNSGFPPGSFGMPPFGGAIAGSLADPYQRSAFGYGM